MIILFLFGGENGKLTASAFKKLSSSKVRRGTVCLFLACLVERKSLLSNRVRFSQKKMRRCPPVIAKTFPRKSTSKHYETPRLTESATPPLRANISTCAP